MTRSIIRQEFIGLRSVVTVCEVLRPVVTPLNLEGDIATSPEALKKVETEYIIG